MNQCFLIFWGQILGIIPVSSWGAVTSKPWMCVSGQCNYVSHAMSCLRRLQHSFCVSLRNLRDSWLLCFCPVLAGALTGDGGSGCTPLCALVLPSTLAALRCFCCFCLELQDGWESFWTYRSKNSLISISVFCRMFLFKYYYKLKKNCWNCNV